MSEGSQSSGNKKPTNEKTNKNTQFFQNLKGSIFKITDWVPPCFRWFCRNSEPIRNWLIVVFTGILALYTYRLFETSVHQAEAFIDIIQHSVTQTPDKRFNQIIVTAEIINISQTTSAENVEIESRFDLLDKDFSNRQIIYTKPIKKFRLLTGFSNIILRDTVDVSRDSFDKVGRSLWPFLHMKFKYDNGFDERIITNFGFSYDINNTNESKICKHTYKE